MKIEARTAMPNQTLFAQLKNRILISLLQPVGGAGLAFLDFKAATTLLGR